MTRTTPPPRSAAEQGPRTAAGRALVEWAQNAFPEQEAIWRDHALLIEAEAAAPALDVERLTLAICKTVHPLLLNGAERPCGSHKHTNLIAAEYARLSADEEGGTTVIHKRQSVNGCVTCDRKWSDHSIQERSLR